MSTSRWTMLIVVGLLSACGHEDPGPYEDRTTTHLVPGRGKGEELFAQRCTACHGATGHGDGAAAAGLNPKPRNFHDPAWQAAVTDEQLLQVIQYGGAAIGKSAAMPAQADLKDPTLLASLVAHLRDLGTTP